MGGHNNWINLGMSYIGGVLNQNGHDVKIYNTDYSDEREEDIKLKDVFGAHSEYKTILENREHPIWKEIKDCIESYSPEMVGITMVLTATYKGVENIARIVKEINPNIKVVVGGVFASLYPKVIESEYFDYLVRGEGEYVMLDIVNGVPLENIKGLSYKVDGKIIINEDRSPIEDLDMLPFPNIENLVIKIKEVGDNFGILACSRGCPMNCIFCSSPRFWHRKVRFRSVENVLDEIEFRYKKHGVRKFYFCDDNINLHKDFIIRLTKGILDRDLKIRWICEAKVGYFDKEMIVAMKKAGCKRVKLGIESGSDRILKLMKKGIAVQQIRDTAKLLHEGGLNFTAYALIGMPTETREEMMETLGLLKEINPKYISLSVATPHIGTELYEMMERMKIEFPTEEWHNYYHQSWNTVLNPNVNPEIINEFLRLNDEENRGRNY
jgi:radical SAM superfamily enzyme YgiQ (UPF0313 family)